MKENGFSALNDDSLHIVRSESKIDGLDDDLEKGINLRPQYLSEFIGQENVKKKLVEDGYILNEDGTVTKGEEV